MVNRQPILFVHIPKTGGTSLWAALRQSYGAKYVLRIQEDDADANNTRLDTMIASGEAQRYKLLGGHVFFEEKRDFPHMTMLREPVNRAVSAYYHALRVPTNRHYEKLNSENIDLEEGLRVVSPNLHVRYLAAVPTNREPDSADLTKAKYNLEHHFEGVGLLERFHESLILFKLIFGGKIPYYRLANVGTNKKKSVNEHIETVAREVNALDVELYQFAVELFEQRLGKHKTSVSRNVFLFERTLPLWGRIQSLRKKK